MSNSVSLTGKVSRIGGLRYTPSGTPVYDFTVAVGQRQFDQESIGYYEVLVFGEEAEATHSKLRIGVVLKIDGALWSRNYRNRKGIKVNETKIIAHSIGGNGEKG